MNWDVAHKVAAIASVQAHRDLGVDRAGYVHVHAALTRAGVDVLARPMPTLFGVYQPGRAAEEPSVLLNARLNIVTQRHTAAHELGHHRLGHGAAFDVELDRARMRGRYHLAAQLLWRASDAGFDLALMNLMHMWDQTGQSERAEHLAQQAFEAGDATLVADLADTRHYATRLRQDRDKAISLYLQAHEAGDPDVWEPLALLRKEEGDHEGAEELCREAARTGTRAALGALARMRAEAGAPEEAERLAREAADAGDTRSLQLLAELREKAGDRDRAERLYRQAADAEELGALVSLARLREEAGDGEGAERLYRQAIDARHYEPIGTLADLRNQAGDYEGAERLYQYLADHDPYGLGWLGWVKEVTGDPVQAERLYQRAIDAGDARSRGFLTEMRIKSGDLEEAERLAQHGVDAGDPEAPRLLALVKEEAGDLDAAERLYSQLVDSEDAPGVAEDLARMRERAGDLNGARHWYRQAVDSGVGELENLARVIATATCPAAEIVRYGLEPDGAPSGPW
ncbi:ImmA/IrrE family metallo-endopeptidase [Yinghuangia sp. YIM S09857]|uniref:ImmA/IrrE family metallo-endopeptidase n=1 Tax=Yinghuangia sp. YIM S09857 TaxID=3436929 RepID=UPI003F53A6E9